MTKADYQKFIIMPPALQDCLLKSGFFM